MAKKNARNPNGSPAAVDGVPVGERSAFEKTSAPLPGSGDKNGLEGHEDVARDIENDIVQGVPLYDDYGVDGNGNNVPGHAGSSGLNKFVVQGYKDIWAAVVFLAVVMLTLVLGGMNFKSNIHYIATHNVTSEAYTGRDGHTHYRPVVTRTDGVDDATVSAHGTWILAKFFGVTAVSALAGFGGLVLLSMFPRKAIIGANVIVAVLYGLLGLSMLAGGSWWGAIIAFIIAPLQLLWLYLVRSRIPFATLLLKLSVNTIMKYKATIAISFGGVLAFYGYSVFFASMAFPLMTRMLEQNMHSADPALFVLYMLLFFWAGQVAINVVHVTVAGLIATWYFASDNMPPNPTKASFKRAVTTSFGSICFGSLLVAIIKTLRQLAEMNRRHDNDFVRCIMECILQILESIMEYFNQYAFIHVAIYGCGYVEAAKRTWRLCQDQFFRAYFNDCLVEPTLGLTALGIGCFVGGTAYLLGGAAFGSLAWFISLMVAMIMLRCVSTAVPTIFVCYAEVPAALQSSSPELYSAMHASDMGQDVV